METDKKPISQQPLSQNPTSSSTLLHSMSGANKSMFSTGVLVIFITVVIAGVATGFGASRLLATSSISGPGTTQSTDVEDLKKGDTYGSPDEKTFNDTAEGKLVEGGIEGEGEYHLERPGGDSQSVYLTSSTIDLSQFIGKKVKVWGQTNTAQTAGWLMDVGRLQLL